MGNCPGGTAPVTQLVHNRSEFRASCGTLGTSSCALGAQAFTLCRALLFFGVNRALMARFVKIPAHDYAAR